MPEGPRREGEKTERQQKGDIREWSCCAGAAGAAGVPTVPPGLCLSVSFYIFSLLPGKASKKQL